MTLIEQVFVANHTSIIDVVILSQSMCFAIVGQKHPGFMGPLSLSLLKIVVSFF
jgi:hypothetical protein